MLARIILIAAVLTNLSAFAIETDLLNDPNLEARNLTFDGAKKIF
jgi:hypothetical protein